MNISSNLALIYSNTRTGTAGANAGFAQLINTTNGSFPRTHWEGLGANDQLGRVTPAVSPNLTSILISGHTTATRYSLAGTGVFTIFPLD